MKEKDAEAFLEAMDRKAKMFAPAARATFNANKELCSWVLNPLARWAHAAYGDAIFDDAARGYAQYAFGIAKARLVYEKAGRYTPEEMPEIMDRVYEDASYMVPYMWAAILIYTFWPSMIDHIAVFRDQFVRKLPKGARVLELASGHGVLSLLAAEDRPDLRIEGADISPPAVAVANRLLAASGHKNSVSFVVRDALQTEGVGEQYDGIISGMLAEHLPDPKPLFTAMGKKVAPKGLVFFSTALESAQRDHVYEYNWESQPLQMAETAGLRASLMVSGAAEVPAGSRFLPRATAYILHKR